MGFFYDELFTRDEPFPEMPGIPEILGAFADGYDDADAQDVWFDRIKAIADRFGYASDMKAYKENPEAWKGSVADVSNFIRIAVTGRSSSPDMYAVMQILGKDRVTARLRAAIAGLEA